MLLSTTPVRPGRCPQQFLLAMLTAWVERRGLQVLGEVLRANAR